MRKNIVTMCAFVGLVGASLELESGLRAIHALDSGLPSAFDAAPLKMPEGMSDEPATKHLLRCLSTARAISDGALATIREHVATYRSSAVRRSGFAVGFMVLFGAILAVSLRERKLAP